MLIEILQKQAQMVASMGTRQSFVHKSIEEFVCAFGTYRTHIVENYNGLKTGQGTPKQCFHNSIELVQTCPELTYCEGYATSSAVGFLPIHHAWCLTPDGAVFDITATCLDEYFGVPFRNEIALKHHELWAKKNGSLLDHWQDSWPLLRLSREEVLKILATAPSGA